MSLQGYQERLWWWKVAKHLDDAQLALVNALALNADDPAPVHALQNKLREGQSILLAIFRWKGLLPGEAPKAAQNVVQGNQEVAQAIAEPPGVEPVPMEEPLVEEVLSGDRSLSEEPVLMEAEGALTEDVTLGGGAPTSVDSSSAQEDDEPR